MKNLNVDLKRFYVLGIFISTCITTIASSPARIKPSTVADVIASDRDVCDSTKVLFNSSLAETCRDVEYPLKKLPLIGRTVDTFLCLGIYDTSYLMCKLNDTDAHLAEIGKEFDSKFSKTTKKISLQDVCSALATSSQPKYNKTLNEVVELNRWLHNVTECERLCTNLDSTMNPLCVLLLWSRQFVGQVQLPRKESKEASVAEKVDENLTHETKQSSQTESQPVSTIQHVANNGTLQQLNTTVRQENLSNTAQPLADSNKLQSVETSHVADVNNSNKEHAAVEQIKLTTVGPTVPPSKNKNPQSSPKKIPMQKKMEDPVSIPSGVQEPSGNGKNSKTKSQETSTLSDNTQDQEELPNQQDYNHDDDNPLDLSTDNHNQLETSEQREILPFHTMRVEEDSHFFAYFTVISVLCICGYIGYHNKQKILAIALEGRRGKSGRGRRRPSTASYRKLDCTLEEAVTSQCNSNVTHVIY
ncbi:trans-Golgi network integral membrane protein 1-like [Orussus abietinus]|uniref:trans-Golgi network integral membrane protein 1-like n=1 Tax=Orussus abietinus TaxID=222816 RepID=UPI0006264671|nr:trans-Golgi network integral membrane protein 1-like [Orussus abietinus]